VRVVTLHPDVLVATSAIWQTNCVIVRGPGAPVKTDPGGDESTSGAGTAGGETGASSSVRVVAGYDAQAETFVIDSPILPDELDALPSLVEQARFPEPSGLLATHGDWDHLLGRLAFPALAVGCAESTAQRLSGEPGAAQRELRAFDRGLYVERPHPLMLGQLQGLPVPGRCEIGGRELELHPADGHTSDGMAVWIGWARVLVAGDYLSTVEPPKIEAGGATDSYLSALDRLRPLVRSAAHVVPGHGPGGGGGGGGGGVGEEGEGGGGVS
jgi:glyoxylase-like metal-dependent hydrolase (beta-lactamase superfamily II)